jgi:hypothetical protein
MKRIHYISGIIITVFVLTHLFNHSYSFFGTSAHIEMMNNLRVFYRNVFSETILLLAVLVQIVSGIKLFVKKRKTVLDFFDKLQLWSGFYLAIFLVFHLSAVLIGRFILCLDTNFYFGVAGLNTFPFNLFFIPYYGLAILSFFAHVSAIHAKKMKRKLLGIKPKAQSHLILIVGIVLTLIVFYGLTNGYSGVTIPKEYGILIGK